MTAGVLRADWPVPEGIQSGTTLRGSSAELPAEPRWLKQVHGARVVRWGSGAFGESPPEADAIVSGEAGSICLVKTADCLPILLCADDGSEIGAVHAGWRGLAAGVIDAALDAMATPATRLLAWIGPAISQDAYEVGDDVRQQFEPGPRTDDWFRPNRRGRFQADLPAIARHQLERREVAVWASGLCTYSDPDRFYSYRREGPTGRLLTYIYRPLNP